MSSNDEQNQIRESPQRFFKLLQAGDLAFLELMEYAFVIFGITKHGKTTLSHYLVNNLLKAYLNERKQVHYRLETNKLSDAKIGQKMQSETQIPNKFQTPIKINQNTLFVIDNPGQLDSFGINRVLSNAYFHYRVFSKVKNMKFILVFDSNTFSNNIKQTNAIFKLFFQSFVDFQKISNQMLKSISIIFTKVNKNISIGDIHQKISAYESTFNKVRTFSNQQMQFLSKLFKQCKQNSKIKLFRQAELNVEAGKCTFLTELDKRMQYFSRKTDESQKLNSLYFNEKRVEMDQIKFSQSKTVLKLAVDDFSKQQINNLFEELSLRGNRMFGLLFNFIQNLFQFILFDYDQCQNVGSRIDRSEILRQTRQKKLRDILLKLQSFTVQYHMSEKYRKSRELIIQKYKQKLSKSTKLQTSVDRLDLSMKLQQFCSIYSENKFIDRRPEQILACKQDIENIFFRISEVFSNNQQIGKLSRFLYNINTFMNQLVIFSKIILPSEKEGKQKLNSFLSQQPFNKFFACLYKFPEFSSVANQSIVKNIEQRFKLSNSQAKNVDTSQLIRLYFNQKPAMLINHTQNSELLLQKLSKIALSEQTKIDCVTLMFNSLKQQYHTFMHFKKIINKNKNKDQQFVPQFHFNPKDVKKMILSFINLLKQFRKIKDLFCYKVFDKYRIPTYQMSTITWNYIVKLFFLLLQCGNNQQKVRRQKESQQNQRQSIMNSELRQSRRKSPSNKSKEKLLSPNNSKTKITLSKKITQIQSQEYQEIITQILSDYQNIGFIEEIFNKIIHLHKSNFDQVTLQTCAKKINQKYGKILQGYENQCMIMFEQEKKKHSQKIISNLIKYATILNKHCLKDRALTQCYQAMKYTQYHPEKIQQIEDKIQQIEIHNSLNGQWVKQIQDYQKIHQFQPSLTVKRKLTKFTQDNNDYEVLACVKIDIFSNKNS